MVIHIGRDAQLPRPSLILVAGAPATGKTTLALHLSDTLHLPLLAKDALKEILAEDFPVQSVEQSQALGRSTFRLLYALVSQLLAADVSLVVEANFFHGMAETDLRPLLENARAVLIHCATTREVSLDRYMRRFERGERHPSHLDGERITQIQDGDDKTLESWKLAEPPLELDIPKLLVDTTNGYTPDFGAIVAFINSAVSED